MLRHQNSSKCKSAKTLPFGKSYRPDLVNFLVYFNFPNFIKRFCPLPFSIGWLVHINTLGMPLKASDFIYPTGCILYIRLEKNENRKDVSL